MPYLNFKHSNQLSDDVAAKVATVLTDLTALVLKKKRELTALTFEHVPEQQWYIGGVSLAAQRLHSFCLDIKVTEGTNTKDEKAQFVSQAFASMESILGSLAAASYVVIHEVRADAWGYRDQTQEYRYIDGKSGRQGLAVAAPAL